eukprot:bmy_18968T0
MLRWPGENKAEENSRTSSFPQSGSVCPIDSLYYLSSSFTYFNHRMNWAQTEHNVHNHAKKSGLPFLHFPSQVSKLTVCGESEFPKLVLAIQVQLNHSSEKSLTSFLMVSLRREMEAWKKSLYICIRYKVLTTMKLLILTCLVTAALARPKHPLRHQELFQNEPDSKEEVLKERKFLRFAVASSSEELREENINELSRRELLREKHSDEHKDTRNESTEDHGMEDAEQRQSGSSSSSEQKHIQGEDVPSERDLEAIHDHKYIPREKIFYHPYLREPMRVVNQEPAYFYLEPFQQFYQLDAHPHAAWYYPPQVTQYIASPSFSDIPKPIASENEESSEFSGAPQLWSLMGLKIPCSKFLSSIM